MGKANRQRRRMKEQARRQARAARAPRGGARCECGDPLCEGGDPSLPGLLAAMVMAAMEALDAGRGEEVDEVVAALASQDPRLPGWPELVDEGLTSFLQAAVDAAWHHGWQPAEIVRQASRLLGASDVRLVRDALAADLARYAPVTLDPRWRGQVEEHDIRVWWPSDLTLLAAWAEHRPGSRADLLAGVLRVHHLLGTLVPLEVLGPLPGQAPAPRQGAGVPGDVDERVLERVRALLAKAESTTFEAEADTFTAGAQALMARYSIDRAMLAGDRDEPDPGPRTRRVAVDAPYEGPKAMLLGAIAEANHCRSVWHQSLGMCSVVGFAADLDAVEMLFTSLLVQATTAMTRTAKGTGGGGGARTRSFRQSFLISFATRIGQRLTETIAEQTAEAVVEHGESRLLPVLASREHEVHEAVVERFPEMTATSAGSVTNEAGWAQGRVAADLAHLSAGAELSG